jgi:hypothetical protein
MPHCTPEQLALAALGEQLPAQDAAHLAACVDCSAEVASLRRSVDAVAVPQLAAPDAPVPPPAHVWDAIAAATGVSAAPRSPAPEPEPVAEVLPFRSRRRPLLLVAAAVLVGAAVGAGAVAVVRGGDGEDVRAVETAALDPLAGNEASGTAEVVVRKDGSRALEVQLDAPAPADGYYEVWLIEPSITDMVSLGVARSGSQTFELPAGLDIGEFSLVDVSLEPLDGNPLHSSVSDARGQLES